MKTPLLADLKIGTKLMLLLAIFLLGFGLLGLFAFGSLNRVKVNGPIYAQIMENNRLIQDILPPPLYIIESHMNALEILEAAEEGADDATVKRLIAQAAELRTAYERTYALWMSKLPEGELKQALASSHDPALLFYQIRDQKFIPSVVAGLLDHAASIHHGVLQPAFNVHRFWVERAVSVATRRATQDEKEAAAAISGNIFWLFVIGSLVAGATVLFSLLISRSIAVPLRKISAAAHEIAGGRLDVAQIRGFSGNNEVGALVHAFNTMTAQLAEYVGKLRASETKYRIVADNTFDWEFWRSPAGDYLYSSPSCERITGYTPADFAADPSLVLRLMDGEHRPAFHAHELEMLRGVSCPSTELEFRITAADGTTRWISHVCCPVYDESGAFLGKRGTNRDITQRKMAELQLVEAKEQAETATRAKSAFITAMSHELRTPLNSIMGYTQILLQDQNLNEAQRRHLDVMLASAQHLLTLINEVLEMGRIESEKLQLDERSFDLPALLQQVLGMVRREAEQKGLEVRAQSASLPPYVRGDQRKLQQVLLNLVENAVRFTRSGCVTVTASFSAGTLRCQVADTGTGIAKEKLEAIFEPFTQLGREGQVTEGTGLGLPIAKRLVTLMRGRMSVESEPGKGSSFTVEVPLSEVPEGEAVPLLSAQLPVEETAGNRDFDTEEVPPPERLQELSELSLLGDMKRIKAWAEAVMADGRYFRFADEVRGLAAGFKAKAISSLVDHYLGKEKSSTGSPH